MEGIVGDLAQTDLVDSEMVDSVVDHEDTEAVEAAHTKKAARMARVSPGDVSGRLENLLEWLTYAPGFCMCSSPFREGSFPTGGEP